MVDWRDDSYFKVKMIMVETLFTLFPWVTKLTVQRRFLKG